MAGTDVASGGFEAHGDTVHPIDASATPGVQAPTAIAPNASAREQGAVWDGTADFAAVASAGEADCQAAMDAAMDTRNAMLGHYQAGILGLGSPAIDEMQLPPVPDTATPPSQSDLYPWGGLEPVPAGVGFAHGGNEPLPQ